MVFMILQENLGENKRLLKNPIPEAKTTPTFAVYEWRVTQPLLPAPGPQPWGKSGRQTESKLGKEELAWICSDVALSNHF